MNIENKLRLSSISDLSDISQRILLLLTIHTIRDRKRLRDTNVVFIRHKEIIDILKLGDNTSFKDINSILDDLCNAIWVNSSLDNIEPVISFIRSKDGSCAISLTQTSIVEVIKKFNMIHCSNVSICPYKKYLNPCPKNCY